jgi:hypothetical protein
VILEAQEWENNSELIRAVFDMHVWPKRWAQDRHLDVLDLTYGRGLWWKWQLPPERSLLLHKNDVREGGYDYRDMP